MSNYNLQIPCDYENEWKAALPLISRKKAQELSKIACEMTNSRGWHLSHIYELGFVFKKYKNESKFISGMKTKRKVPIYLLMPHDKIYTNFASIVYEGWKEVVIVEQVNKYLDPCTNETIYANMAPFTVLHFYSSKNGNLTTKKLAVNHMD